MFDRAIYALHIQVESNRRIIAISDIHANLTLLKKLLKKINYQADQDELFLVGDLLEKGNQNMETLHYIMDLAKDTHVHPMFGNCDVVCKNVLYEDRLDFLKEILLSRQYSIIHEMAHAVGMSVTPTCDMHILAKAIQRAFPKELAFIDVLPHVIETQDYIFAHAGIMNEFEYGNEMRDVMTQDRFLDQDVSFHKYVIVGHMPLSEYCDSICNLNPRIDYQKHIISIDGGNIVKKSGQLNALLIKDNVFTYAYSDQLKKIEVLKSNHERTSQPVFIPWHDSVVEILKKEDERVYCRLIKSGKKVWIPNQFLYEQNGKKHVDDYTNYHLHIKKGEQVKLVSSYKNYSLIKKQGIMGWVCNDCIKLK